MSIQEFLKKIKTIQRIISEFIESETNYEENYQNFESIIKEYKIQDDQHMLKLLSHYISIISDNHYRDPQFIPKIKQISKSLELNYSTQLNEREKINSKYDYICELIRKDSVKDFIACINKNSYPLDYKLPKPNNYFGYKKEVTLIEYATFYGSIQIFNYLRLNGAKLTSSLWICSIHGRNAEIIHTLEENNVAISSEEFNNFNLEEVTYERCFIEAIKCHHNDIANYFLINFLDSNSRKYISYYLQYYNYLFIQDDFLDCSCFAYLVKYEYFDLVKIFLSNKDFDVNYAQVENSYIKNRLSWTPPYVEPYYTDGPIKEEKTALYFAIENRNYEIIKLLLEHQNIDVNKINNTWYEGYYEDDSCHHFKHTIVEKYKDEKTALWLAIEKNDLYIFELLLKNKNIDVNKISKISKYVSDDNDSETTIEEKTPLYCAIEKYNTEFIELLLSNNDTDVNIINIHCHDYTKGVGEKTRETALCYAIEKKYTNIVKLLLSNNKIDVNIINYGYGSPLSYEAEWDKVFDTDEFDQITGFTALILAIEIENIEIIELLLANNKIDVNIMVKIQYNHYDGDNEVFVNSALFCAVQKGNLKIINLLLQKKDIDLQIKDGEGKTPIDYAKTDEIKQLLKC